MDSDITLWLTRVGALAGFVAFMLKAWEFHQDRRPNLRVVLAGTDDAGDRVLVINSSKAPTSVYHYSVHAVPNNWLSRLWPLFTERSLIVKSRQPIHVEVPGPGQATLILASKHIALRVVIEPYDLYIQLWTSARRRPFNRLLLTTNRTS